MGIDKHARNLLNGAREEIEFLRPQVIINRFSNRRLLGAGWRFVSKNKLVTKIEQHL